MALTTGSMMRRRLFTTAILCAALGLFSGKLLRAPFKSCFLTCTGSILILVIVRNIPSWVCTTFEFCVGFWFFLWFLPSVFLLPCVPLANQPQSASQPVCWIQMHNAVIKSFSSVRWTDENVIRQRYFCYYFQPVYLISF